MKFKDDYGLTVWGFTVVMACTLLILTGFIYGMTRWQFAEKDKNYREYCEAIGRQYRKAGGIRWCE